MPIRRAIWKAGWPARTVLLGVLRAYQVSLGRLTAGHCRFHPSCSEYARLCVAHMGIVKGVLFTGWRLARCSPLTLGGVDYPPGVPGRPADVFPYEGVIHSRRTAGGVQ